MHFTLPLFVPYFQDVNISASTVASSSEGSSLLIKRCPVQFFHFHVRAGPEVQHSPKKEAEWLFGDYIARGCLILKWSCLPFCVLILLMLLQGLGYLEPEVQAIWLYTLDHESQWDAEGEETWKFLIEIEFHISRSGVQWEPYVMFVKLHRPSSFVLRMRLPFVSNVMRR